MRRLIDWLHGWAVTLDIMLFDRELYRQLRDWSDIGIENDFIEVEAPKVAHYHHPDAACTSCDAGKTARWNAW